jgi:probable HAF family extracellular repeat protein
MTAQLTVAAIGLLFTVATPAAALPFFAGLGDLAGGSFSSTAAGVSGDGTTVVGSSTSDLGAEAFRWTAETGMVGLGQAPRYGGSNATDASADGSVVVGSSRNAFRWTEAGGRVDLGDAPGGLENGVGYGDGVSADGSMVVGTTNSQNGIEAFRWTEAGGFQLLGDLPGGNYASRAFDISADGSIVVGESYSAASQPFGWPEAFVWSEENGMRALGDLPGGVFRSTAQAISADGSMVVGTSSIEGGVEAFRWTEATGMVGLGMLREGDTGSFAQGVSGDGRWIVGTGTRSEMFTTESGDTYWRTIYIAYLWDEDHGMRDLQELIEQELGLDLGGWQLQQARAISDDGTVIVGHGINPEGHMEAWRAVIPEPAPAVLFGAGLFWLGIGRQRRRGSR